MSNLWNRIKTEPAIVTQLVQAVLGLLVAFEIINLTDNQTGAILSFSSAGLGLVLAITMRAFKWPLITALVQTAVILAVSFGWNASSTQTATLYALTAAIGAILVRQTGTPETKLPALQITGK